MRLTVTEVLRDIPFDAAALVTYALLLLFVGFVWFGNRGDSAGVRSERPGDGRIS